MSKLVEALSSRGLVVRTSDKLDYLSSTLTVVKIVHGSDNIIESRRLHPNCGRNALAGADNRTARRDAVFRAGPSRG